MFTLLKIKLKEAVSAVLPVSLLVLLVNLTPLVDFNRSEMVLFILSTLGLIIGIAFFNMGADLSMSPMGNYIGSGLAKSKKLWLMIVVGFAMGILITLAEPNLSVLADQLSAVIKPGLLKYAIAQGVAVFVVFIVLKMVFRQELSSLLFFFYLSIFSVTCLLLMKSDSLMATAFDSGGVATGPLTVPFLMSLGLGMANTIGGKRAEENSFGVVAFCSIGPVLAILVMALTVKGDVSYEIADYSVEAVNFEHLFAVIADTFGKVLKAVACVFVFFIALNELFLKIPKKTILKIAKGLIFTVIGLVLFLSFVSIGFMPIGYKLGYCLSSYSPEAIVLGGLVLGAVVVIAEPSVHVLNKQVEEVTKGMISKKSMLVALCTGIGIAIGLSMLRIVLGFSLLYYLIPGYLISLGLSMFVPKIYTGIAFDSGGVASGPLTSSFILPMAIGACVAMGGENNVLLDAFGVVAMVSMAPPIAVQVLGFSAVAGKIRAQKSAIKRIFSKEDEQIIRFIK